MNIFNQRIVFFVMSWVIAALFLTSSCATAEDGITIKTYSLTEKTYAPILDDTNICWLTKDDFSKALLAGFTINDLAGLELSAAYPGISIVDPFIFEGKKAVRQLGGNALSFENSLDYTNSKKISDVTFKAYRIEDADGELSFFCLLHDWELAAQYQKNVVKHRLKKKLDTLSYRNAEDRNVIDDVYACYKVGFDKLSEKELSQIPTINSVMASSSVFASCISFWVGEPNLIFECSASSQNYAMELSTPTSRVLSDAYDKCHEAMYSKKEHCSKINSFRSTRLNEYDEYSELYYQVYDSYPECDTRNIKKKIKNKTQKPLLRNGKKSGK